MAILSAYPYVKVAIDTRGLMPTATRAVGNVGIVGRAGGLGTATLNVPVMVTSELDARKAFATTGPTGAVTATSPLYAACKAALAQDPGPSRIYAVAVDGAGDTTDYAAGLAVLAAAEVQIVVLAGQTAVGAAGTPPRGLRALADHVETVSSAGKRRIGVAHVDPDLTVPASKTYAEVAESTYAPLKSPSGRMVLVAGRVPTDGGAPTFDLAAATAGAIAGLRPHYSTLLKQVRGVEIPLERQFTPTEIAQLSDARIESVIDPELIPGEGFFLASGLLYTSDTTKSHVDTIRVIDDLEFRLKAGLIGEIGNTRIDRFGVQQIISRVEGILGPLRRARVIDAFSVYVPLLATLEKEEAARTNEEGTTLATAREERRVEVLVTVTYGPAVHVLDLQVTFKN